MKLELAKLEDFDKYYVLKVDDSNVYWTGWLNKANYDNLKSFYINAVNNQNIFNNRKIFLAYENNEVIGYIYIDYVNDVTFHLSPAIHSKFQGKGYGKELIKLGIQEGLRLGYKNMEAYIREDNIASQKCFIHNNAIKTDIYENKYIENLNKEIKMIKYLYKSK